MASAGLTLDKTSAVAYLGETVLVELVWDGDPESFWSCVNIVGVVLPMDGVYGGACFMTVDMHGKDRHPCEIYFEQIRSIRVMRHRDRHGSGNVLGRIAHPTQAGSRAALPARRNSSTVPSNGSTGAAHP